MLLDIRINVMLACLCLVHISDLKCLFVFLHLFWNFISNKFSICPRIESSWILFLLQCMACWSHLCFCISLFFLLTLGFIPKFLLLLRTFVSFFVSSLDGLFWICVEFHLNSSKNALAVRKQENLLQAMLNRVKCPNTKSTFSEKSKLYMCICFHDTCTPWSSYATGILNNILNLLTY